ncbi:MAG TPA: pseudouridine synthase [Vicinamibacterales bacterium]|nr:pseudouridine synthase [Vicinamibacterales bacterium]
MLTRLNKLLSRTGVASRRVADELIRQGRVEINGRVVTELGTKADLEHDEVKVDGRRLKRPPTRRYLLMSKPRGVVSTRSDPQRRTTVVDLLARAGIAGYFYPVGRLDAESEGLILLTNDGDFAERVMHPRYELERTYEAQVAGVPDERDLDRLRRGVEIDGRRTLPARVRVLRMVTVQGQPQAVIELTIREGRNRQVRRMCDAIAHPVERLRRTKIGTLADPALRAGDFRDLTPAEIRALTAPRPASASRRPPAATDRPPARRRSRSRG